MIAVHGVGAAEALRRLLAIPHNTGSTRSEIFDLFSPAEQDTVSAVLNRLIDAQIFVPVDDPRFRGGDAPETSQDLFYWNYGTSSHEVNNRINVKRLVILGVNTVSQYLTESLRASGIANFLLVDYPPLRNLRLFDESGSLGRNSRGESPTISPIDFQEWADTNDPHSFDGIVATSDFGATEPFRHWNNVSVQAKCPFLPACMTDTRGLVGPLVVPGETSCYECYWMRQNSHLSHLESRHAADKSAFEGQLVSGVHPALAAMVGNLAAFELIRFYGNSSLAPNVGTLIDIEMASPSLNTHKVLKVPRCLICSPLVTRSSMNPNKNVLGPLGEGTT